MDNSSVRTQSQPWWATVLTPEGVRKLSEVDVGSIISTGKRWTKICAKTYVGKSHVCGFVTQYGIVWGDENIKVICHGEIVPALQAKYIDTFIQNRIDSMPIIQIIHISDAQDMLSITVEDMCGSYWSDNCKILEDF